MDLWVDFNCLLFTAFTLAAAGFFTGITVVKKLRAI
jgi:hypothetical protein